MSHTPPAVPAFTKWPSFPFEGEFRVKNLDDPVDVEPPRKGEGTAECHSCNAPDNEYIWVSERWRVRAMDRPSGLPAVLILESRSHLDLGDLPNLLAAELGVMTVRLERAIRSLDGVARVHVNRWGDGSAHLHMWFLARPYGRLQLRGTFLSLWDDILPPIPESQWRESLALVAAWLAEFGGRPLAEPPRIQWQAPSNLTQQEARSAAAGAPGAGVGGDVTPGSSSDAATGDGSGTTKGSATESPGPTSPATEGSAAGGSAAQPGGAVPSGAGLSVTGPSGSGANRAETGTAGNATGTAPRESAVPTAPTSPGEGEAVAAETGSALPPAGGATGERYEPEDGLPVQR